MGNEYALVHLHYTIPPAILLTLLYWPLFTKFDVYKVTFLIAIAVVSTIPWDSYLIRNRIWTYPSHAIVGPTLFDIPLEEVFFFFVQTYNTSLIYLILSKPTLQSTHLQGTDDLRLGSWRRRRLTGQAILLAFMIWGWFLVRQGGVGTYTGLILVWSMPFLLFLWSLAYQFILDLPWTNTVLPITIPTVYLWFVDALALRKGTWAITTGTKYGICLFDSLEIEEALFFLITNILVVFGLLAFDHALAVWCIFPDLFKSSRALLSHADLMKALLVPCSKYDQARLRGLREAVYRLKRKSRSFYLASSTFPQALRIDLVLLYSFCRVADDLVDNASTAQEAAHWIDKLHKFLDITFSSAKSSHSTYEYVRSQFPAHTHSALLQFPANKLSRQPLQDLLRGFEMDLVFNTASPIKTEEDLYLYSERVAGTVAQMCIQLIFNIYQSKLAAEEQRKVIAAGNCMGVALQYVNIARDTCVDAQIGRVYLPLVWLSETDLTYEAILKDPRSPQVETLRVRLLDKAFSLHQKAKRSIALLPEEVRAPLSVAVESYMEIGRTLKRDGFVVQQGRATVPKWRSIIVAWRTLNARSIDA